MSGFYAEVPPERLLEGHTPTVLGELLDALQDLRPGSEQRVKLRGAQLADSGGEAVITFTPPPGLAWEIERIAITGAGTMDVYVGEIDELYLEDHSTGATKDIADETRPIWVPANTTVFFVFSSAGAGTRCTVNAQAIVQHGQ